MDHQHQEMDVNGSETVMDYVTSSNASPNPCGNFIEKASKQRTRKRKRPFSPEPIGSEKKLSARGRLPKRELNQNDKNSVVTSPQTKSFSCDRCGATSITDPSRCRLPASQLKKTQTMRKKLDPVTNKILILCNACGLAFSRTPKREKVAPPPIEDRHSYLAEAEAFAKSLAQQVGKPAAERLYCPAFKTRPCGCIQTFISHQGDEEGSSLEKRVDTLLQLFNTACDLNRRQNLFPEYLISDPKKKNDSNTKTVERKQRQRDYEHFILETRQFLREKFRLCERACQRILLYSNNFLHKRLKSSDQHSRISRQQGRCSEGLLKSIDDLGSITCCLESCSRLALTHSTLLEEWRKQAAQGQRQARRVLAEMLTPSGGTKANCYKFISMVTGCGPSTISSVSHQMRVTKGNREPPEHGLKKWFRENPRMQSSNVSQSGQLQAEGSSLSIASSSQLIQPESGHKLQEQDPKLLLEQQRQELEEAKHQLYLKQQELDRCQQIIDQHLQQQVLPSDHLSGNPLWKVNVVRSSAQNAENTTELLNLPVESNETIMPGLLNGQSVQFIDLVPGTYIAVPSSFDNSAVLTAATDPKHGVLPSNNVLSSDGLQVQQDAIFSENAHPLPGSSKYNSVLIQSENGTIFALSSEHDGVNPIMEEVGPLESANADLYVTAPQDCHGVEYQNVAQSEHCNVSVISTTESRPDGCNHSPSISGHGHIPTSCPTSVIMPPNNIHIGKSFSGEPISECPSILNCERSVETDGGCGGSTSLSSVMLVSPSQQSQQANICMNAFDRLFQ